MAYVVRTGAFRIAFHHIISFYTQKSSSHKYSNLIFAPFFPVHYDKRKFKKKKKKKTVLYEIHKMDSCLLPQESPTRRKDWMPHKPTRRQTLYLPKELLLDLDLNGGETDAATEDSATIAVVDTCPVMPHRRCSSSMPVPAECDGTSRDASSGCRSFSDSMLEDDEEEQLTSPAKGSNTQKTKNMYRQKPRRHHSAPSSPRKRDNNNNSNNNSKRRGGGGCATQLQLIRRLRHISSNDLRRRSEKSMRRSHSVKGLLQSSASSKSSSSFNKSRPNNNSNNKRVLLHRRWESARSLDLDLETIEESSSTGAAGNVTSATFTTSTSKRRIIVRSRSPIINSNKATMIVATRKA